MLSAQYFAFADLVWEGMDASISKSVDWNLPRKKVSYEEFLDSILKTNPEQINDLKRPVNRQYGLLRKFLENYSELEAKGNWFVIKNSSKALRPGDSSEIVLKIKQRLIELSDLEINNATQLYDEDLRIAVISFQRRHGLKDDGIIGKTTIVEMNVTYKERIKQLMVNMERSRWVPVSLDRDYLVVNIPEFKLHVNSGDQLLWSCNIVVGKPIHKTAIFSGDLKYVVFRPYWNVPRSIVVNELLKDMRKDPSYLAKHNMEITGYRDGIPEIRQKPGPLNSLGQVKFLFPNNYNMYLHDTPAKSLFNEPIRAFSHGCMRVQEPFQLAQFLLRNDSYWDDEKIKLAMNTGKERTVTLSQKVPVFIVYFTAFVDRDGKINFRNDIYERDDRLAEMIMKK
jgi:murein L,D-transpeptidase YcbB/YkuD